MTTVRDVLDAQVTERDFMQQIIDLAKLRGWLVYHTHDSRRSEAGFPDLVMVRGGNVLAIEVKSEKGKLTADQEEWLDALDLAIARATCWRPSDWPAIEEALA